MKEERIRYVLARSDEEALTMANYGYHHSSRKDAWKDWMRHSGDHDRKHWKKTGLRSYRVKVTAEVV